MKVLRNTTAYMAASLLPNVVNFFMLPVYTRFLDPQDFGLVSLVLTLTAVLAAFMGLQLSNSISRLFFDHDGPTIKVYLSTILFAIIAINAAILLMFHAVGPSLTALLFPNVVLSYKPYVLLGLVTIFFNGIVNYCNALLRVRERGLTLLLGGICYAILGVVFAVYFVIYRGLGARGVLLAQACNAACRALFLLFMVRGDLGLRFSWPILRGALRYSLPIIPHSLGGILFMYTDKYILSFYVPLAAIGLYDLAGRLARLLQTVVASFHAAISPAFMRASQEDKVRTQVEYRSIIMKWSVGVALLYLCVSVYAEEIITLLAPPKYHAAHRYVPILAGCYVLRSMQGFAVNAIMFEKKTSVIPVITFTAGVSNVVLNLILVPHFGVIAAAWTTLASYACAFALALGFSRRYYPMPFQWGLLAVVYGGMLGLLWLSTTIDSGSLALDIGLKAVLIGLFAGAILWRNIGGLASDARLYYRQWRNKCLRHTGPSR